MTTYSASEKLLYIVAAISTMALHSSVALADDILEVQHTGKVTFVTGGIGDEERDAMRAVQSNYNLRILSAAGASGEYPGDTHIVISDTKGNELVNTDADPLFYAQMPSGHYIVNESSAGQSKKQSVTINAGKPVSITFRWK